VPRNHLQFLENFAYLIFLPDFFVAVFVAEQVHCFVVLALKLACLGLRGWSMCWVAQIK
jgi:hypothetical protein